MYVSNGKGFAVIINNTNVTGSYINTIHHIVQVQKLLRYCSKQGCFLLDQNNSIDWDVIKHAREPLPFDQKIWMTK